MNPSQQCFSSDAWLDKGVIHAPFLSKKGTLSLHNGRLSFEQKNGDIIFDCPLDQIIVMGKTFLDTRGQLRITTDSKTYYFSLTSPWIIVAFYQIMKGRNRAAYMSHRKASVYMTPYLAMLVQWIDVLKSRIPADATPIGLPAVRGKSSKFFTIAMTILLSIVAVLALLAILGTFLQNS